MRIKSNIFEYDNYREYLKDYYLLAKKTNKNFSFRFFAREAGFKACNILKLVMDGNRNISSESVEKFVKGLKLNKEEAVYFRNLVGLTQAETLKDKQFHAMEIMRCRKYRQIYPLNESQFNYFYLWYVSAIRELVCLPDFREDPEWIAKKLIPSITPSEVSRGIKVLLNLQFLVRNKEGNLVQSAANISTADEVTSSALSHFHRQMLELAGASIERVARDKRDISSQTLGVSQSTAGKIKEMIQEFRKKIIEVASGDSSPDSVYQLNFQLFPLALPDKGDE